MKRVDNHVVSLSIKLNGGLVRFDSLVAILQRLDGVISISDALAYHLRECEDRASCGPECTVQI